MTDAVAEVERAMIAIRRSQQRRALSRIAKERGRGGHDPVHELLDVVEELAERGEAGTVTALSTAMGVDQPRASRLVARAVEQDFSGAKPISTTDGVRCSCLRRPVRPTSTSCTPSAARCSPRSWPAGRPTTARTSAGC